MHDSPDMRFPAYMIASLAHRLPLAFAATALAMLLGSCATLSEDACRWGDWFSIGAADGAKGRLPGFLANHAEACAGFGVRPDRADWEAGRQKGLRTYCTPAAVYAEGRAGRALSPVCPEADTARLAFAHDFGREYWRLEQRINRLESKLRDIDRQVRALEPDDAALRGDLLLEELRTRNRINRLRAEQRRFDRPPPV